MTQCREMASRASYTSSLAQIGEEMLCWKSEICRQAYHYLSAVWLSEEESSPLSN